MAAPVILDTYFKRTVLGALGLLKGMSVTLGYFFRPSRILTEQYPENRKTLKLHPAFRGEVIMPHDENGDHKCTGCTLCEKACPNATISVLNTKNIAGKKVLGKYIYRIDQCTLCGLCIEACPFDAIHMGNGFEHARTQRDGFDLILNKKEGRG
jgi:NADH-quinone oxidoreductase subunit I